MAGNAGLSVFVGPSLQAQALFFRIFSLVFDLKKPIFCTSVLYVALPLFIFMATLAEGAPESKLDGWWRAVCWDCGSCGDRGFCFGVGVGCRDGAGAEAEVGVEPGVVGDGFFSIGGRDWGGSRAGGWGAGEGALGAGVSGAGRFFIFARERDQPGSMVSMGAGGVGRSGPVRSAGIPFGWVFLLSMDRPHGS
jgi:hypothetical protein